VCTGALVRGQ